MATTRLNGVLQHLAQPAAAEGSALKVSVNTDKVPRLVCSPPHPTPPLSPWLRGARQVINGIVAAHYGAQHIINAIKEKGHAHVILATGASQFGARRPPSPQLPTSAAPAVPLDPP